MKIEEKIMLLLVPIAFVAIMSAAVSADYAQTTVFFNVPTSTAFTVTLPGQGAVSSNSTQNPNSPPTANIEFNASSSTVNNVVPCVTGGSCQSGEGPSGTPIFQYDNTGNVNISIQLIFNSTLPSGVTVRANSSWDNGGVSNGTAFAGDRPVNATENTTLGTNIDWNAASFLNVYMYANFSAVVGGTRTTRLLNHTSVSS
ncbi:MAG: hypothetical protein QXR53_02980 [Candidatus Norongarragalinales archaeon]